VVSDVTARASLEITQDVEYWTDTASASPHELVSGDDATTFSLMRLAALHNAKCLR